MLIRKNIVDLPAYSAGKATDDKKIIKLNSNECPFEPPRAIYRRAAKIRRINRYHEASGLTLREGIARELGLSADWVVLGNGSGELIKTYLEAFVDKNQEVIIADVTFSLYRLYSLIYDVAIKTIPLNDDLRLNLGAWADVVDEKTGAVFLVNPNNPTGEFFTYEELRKVFAKIPSRVGIFLDEAYIHYTDEKKTQGFKELLLSFPNLFVLRTFSKVGLAGIRMGYGIARPELISVLHKVRPPFNTNVYAQELSTLLCLEKKYLRKIKENNTAQKKFLSEGLRALGLTVFPSEANFLLIKSRPGLHASLEKKGILIRNAQSFGLSADYYRITIGTSLENRKLLAALGEVMQCVE